MREFLKIAGKLRRGLHAVHCQYIFDRALGKYTQDPKRWIYPRSPVIRDLTRGWDNEGWSASAEYLLATLTYALECKGAVLECGSGLSTLMLGVIAGASGQTVWSLEHDQAWASKVSAQLKKYGIDSVRLCTGPLKAFGDFSWYNPPLDSMPEFSLVVCDGPPGSVPGGRYGLLPIMKGKLKAGAIVLLDDAAREEERAVADRWAADLRTTYQTVGSERAYIVLTVPGELSVYPEHKN